MSVRVIFLGRLGNNLFQYALGRIVAENLGFELKCTTLTRHPPKCLGRTPAFSSSALLEDFTELFPNAPLNLDGITIDEPVERYRLDVSPQWSGQTLDLGSILANRSSRRIELGGYFQRFEYYSESRESIRKWFSFRPIRSSFRVSSKDVLVHVRRGLDHESLGISGSVLSTRYYQRVLSGLTNIGNVYLCGTGIDDGVIKALSKYRPIIVAGTPMEDFSFISRFDRIVLSNSTFAWWAAFLSDASAIYAPRSADGRAYCFTGYQDVDLHMRESRYIEVADATFSKSLLK